MDLRKCRVPFTVLVLSILALAAIIVYMRPNEKNSDETSSLRFPTGIPLTLGTVSGIQVDEQQFNIIFVTGLGAASMQADEATVTFGVQTQSESASEAVELNAKLMTEVIEAIKALGITEDDMKTISYSVFPVYSKNDYNEVVGYRVVNMITAKIKDMDLIGKVIDEATDRGANRVQGISFGLSEGKQEELRKKAYIAALDDAEGKAELIAERLDLTITGVLSVSESAYQPYQPYRSYEFGEGATTPIIEGKLSVSVTVHIVYSFE